MHRGKNTELIREESDKVINQYLILCQNFSIIIYILFVVYFQVPFYVIVSFRQAKKEYMFI